MKQVVSSRPKSAAKPLARAAVIGIVVGALAGVPLAAHAGTSYSAQGTFNHGGTAYNQAAVITSSAHAHASTSTWPAASTPAGYIGSRGRLFTSGGSLSCEGTTSYNASTLPPLGAQPGYSCHRYTSGTWYSYGVSRKFNGSTWVDVFTFQSGNQNS